MTWTEDMLQLLREHYPVGGIAGVNRAFVDAGLPATSGPSIHQKARKLKLRCGHIGRPRTAAQQLVEDIRGLDLPNILHGHSVAARVIQHDLAAGAPVAHLAAALARDLRTLAGGIARIADELDRRMNRRGAENAENMNHRDTEHTEVIHGKA